MEQYQGKGIMQQWYQFSKGVIKKIPRTKGESVY
jgi:hypothetical protein